MIRKSFSADTKALDESKGIVEAIVNVGAVLDLQDDIMEPGCWDTVIKAMKAGDVSYPSVVWGHDWSIITGKVLDAEEIPPGNSRLPDKVAKAGGSALRIVAQYNMDTQRGREAFSDVKGGYVNQWSVGFEPDSTGVRFEKGIRLISKVARWPEVSNVLIGASPGTVTTAVKALNPEELKSRQERSVGRLQSAMLQLEWVRFAQMSTSSINDLPDSAFAYIEPGGDKDEDGKTTPRSLRHFPIHDEAHVRNALARASQSPFGDRALPKIRAAARRMGIEVSDDDGGKAYELDVEEKDGKVPDLQGDEAAHNEPLRQAMDAVKTLISQELAEDYPEPDCVMRLTCIWQDLLSWAKGEAVEYTDYGDLPMAMSAYLRAGIGKLAEVEETKSGEIVELPSFLRAVIATPLEVLPSSPQNDVPDTSGDEGLPYWGQLRARR